MVLFVVYIHLYPKRRKGKQQNDFFLSKMNKNEIKEVILQLNS